MQNHPSLDPPRDLILVGFQPSVASLQYTLENGFRKISTREDFIDQYVSFNNGELTFKNPDILPDPEDNPKYVRAIENGYKVLKELSLQLELVEADIDAYIWYREHNGIIKKDLVKMYATPSYLREHQLPDDPPTTKEFMAHITQLIEKGLVGRLY